jgi:hypothetical protein
VESWLIKSFGTFKLRAAVCAELSKKAKREREHREREKARVLELPREELAKKRVKELRLLAEDLQIETEGLIEKGDYVEAIWRYQQGRAGKEEL